MPTEIYRVLDKSTELMGYQVPAGVRISLCRVQFYTHSVQ